MMRLNRRLLLSAAALSGAVMAGLCLWFLLRINAPYPGDGSPGKLVVIERGSSLGQVAETLSTREVIESAWLFEWYMRVFSNPSGLKAGEYRFDTPLTPRQVADKLLRGQVHHHRVTVPEGLDLEGVARALSDQGFGTRQALLDVMHRPELIRDWAPPSTESLEGYLFPDTYFLTRSMSELQIVQTMVGNLRRIWTEDRALRARELGMSIHDVLTLASLVEKETGLASERPLVSAVFHNRLARNIKLACDPTVIYAVKRIKEFDGIIHRSDLELDSPYNTYLYAGLPPGPIANPGLASIDAALQPADVNYLFFVASRDGAHVFSTNYRDHSRAVDRYQR